MLSMLLTAVEIALHYKLEIWLYTGIYVVGVVMRSGNTALHWVCNMLQVLLLHHDAAAISVVDSSGNTALHWASLNGHESVSCLLSCIHKFIDISL